MPPKIEELFLGFDTVIDWLVPIGVVVSLVFIIIGGYMWMTSAGNPDKVKQAQGTLTWAILGLILILLAGLLISTLIDYFV
jgi:purine-cytosine permease-like protein